MKKAHRDDDGHGKSPPSLNEVRGKRIKTLRQWLKMTQLDLAYAVGYKSTGFISLVERGLKGMKAEMRKRAAEALGVHPWVLEWPEDLCDRKLQLLISFMRILQLPNETRQFIHAEEVVRLLEKDVQEERSRAKGPQAKDLK